MNAHEIREKHLGWLITVPASDLNFKAALEQAPLWLLREALAEAERRPQGNKTRIRTLERRIRTLERWEDDPRSVPCPTCNAAATKPCRRPSGHTVFGGGYHSSRVSRYHANRKQAAASS